MLRKLICIWLFIALTLSSAQAEVILLRNGHRVKGNILINNSEVVIVQKSDGTRHQYPKTEVIAIQEESTEEKMQEVITPTPQKNIAIRFAVSGGTAYIPHREWGATMDAHLMIGTQQLLQQPIFLGGSIGYCGVFDNNNNYSWIPLQLVLQYPLILQQSARHAPLLGTSFGYSFATNKQWGGGLSAGIHIGWQYRISDRSSFSLALTAQWQQTHIDIIETIYDTDYTNHIEANILGLGLQFGIQF